LTELSAKYPRFASNGGFRVEGDDSFSFGFDGRNYVLLRQLIDDVNTWSA